ncbi:MAG: hypothetical protein RL754_479 [Bacteroidota bacterium]|jgi:protease-4
MKQFFSAFLGTIAGFVALFFIGIGLLLAVATLGGDEAPKVQEKTLLKIDLNTTIEERSVEDPFAGFDALNFESTSNLGLNDFMIGLEAAATNPSVEGILLNMGGFSAGYGTLEELGEYLKAFKATGKKIYAYGEYYTQKGAYLGALADSTILHPGGILDWRGIGLSLTYYKDFFDKVGIEPLIVRGTNNKYKSAVEPYLSNTMSEENRTQLTHLTDGFWDFLTQAYVEKGVERSKLDSAATNWTGMDAEFALEAGLVDALGYREDVMDGFEERFEIMNWSSFLKTVEQPSAKDRIAVIYANGGIGNGAGDESSIGTKNIISALRKADKNDRVKAIVLRVNSPGGSALTSDMIHHTIGSMSKPVVVSQGNYAASGGYYISCNADAIFTNTTTVTGSIGIFMSLFTAEELITETLGLSIQKVQTHPLANFPNLYEQPDEHTYGILQKMIDRGYDDFTGKVAEGRDTTMEYIKSIGGGRVWLGSDALVNGLADREGNLQDAIAYAASLADLKEYRLYELPAIETDLEKITKALSKATGPKVLQTISDRPAFKELEYLIENPGMQARMNPAFSQF